jgi:hypothetical protein
VTRPLVPVPTWLGRRSDGLSVVALWLASRSAMLVLILAVESAAVSESGYYWREIRTQSEVGLGDTLPEYPAPATLMLALPYALGAGTQLGFQIAFVTLMMLADALFTFLLWRANGGRRDAAVDFWLAFAFLLGPISFLRFDIVPAVLVGVAVLVVVSRPRLAGALTAVGAAVKLWPALIIGVLGSGRVVRGPVIRGFSLTGIALLLVSLAFGGRSRLVSPLTWQAERGLEIESVWATPLMVLRALAPDNWTVEISGYQAYEIFGPGVASVLAASTVATVAGLLLIGGLSVRAFRHGTPSVTAMGSSVLSVIAIVVVINKTLSPQYLLWLGTAMAALLLLDLREPGGGSERVRRLALLLLLVAALTHALYPPLFTRLLGFHGQGFMAVATGVLAVRNGLLIAYAAIVFTYSWRSLGRSH